MKYPREKLEAIFEAAAALETNAQRQDYLDRVCQNPELRREVESLLKAIDEPDSLFKNDKDPAETLASSPIVEQPGTIIGPNDKLRAGRYKILQRIGEGGMGAVYMAEQTEPVTRKVALKIIKLGMDTKQVVARFEAERQALAMMDHPNIAKVLDAGSTETGRPFFVMELVRGVPITAYCDKNKLTTKQRLELFIPVCQAIQHAHQKGIIHRDIKPSNVMVTLNDGVPHPMVIDFGIAKATHHKLTDKTLFTHYAQMIGTPACMSPEQAEMSKLDVDTRTDVYSLGVLLYELMTGTTPFPTKELLSMGYGEMQRIIAEQEPPKPSTRMSTMQGDQRTTVAKNHSMDVSALGKLFKGDLDWIVMKTLEKDRARRYETVNGLVADIQRHLKNEPVSAAAPSLRYQFTKFARRNKTFARAAVAVTLVLVLATGFSSYWAIQAQKQKTKAKTNEQDAIEQGKLADQSRLLAEQETQKTIRQTYASDLNLAGVEIREGNYYRARTLLEAYNQNDETKDLSGWEWRYLSQFCHLDSIDQFGELNHSANALDVSPNGEYLAASSDLGLVVFNLENRSQVAELALDIKVNELAFHPQSRNLIAVAGKDENGDNLVRMLDWTHPGTAPKWSTKFPLPLDGTCSSLEFLPSGLQVIASIADFAEAPYGYLHAINTENGNSRQLPFANESLWSNVADNLAVAPDGHGIVLASDQNTVRLVDIRTGATAWKWDAYLDKLESEGSRSTSRAITFSENGQRVSVAKDWIAIINAQTGESITRISNAHKGWISAVRFINQDTQLLSVGADQVLKIWDVASGSLISQHFGSQGEIWAIAMIPNSSRFITGNKRGILDLWDLNSLDQSVDQFTINTEVIDWQFAKSKDAVRTIDATGKVTEWKAPTFDVPELLLDLKEPYKFHSTGWQRDNNGRVAFSADGEWLAAVDSNWNLGIWDLFSRTKIQNLEIPFENISFLGFVNNGKAILVLSQDSEVLSKSQETEVTVIDIKSTKIITKVKLGKGFRRLQISPDGTMAICLYALDHGGVNNLLQLWRVTPWTKINETNIQSPDNIKIQFSWDQSMIATGGYIDTELYTISELELLKTFKEPHAAGTRSASFSPDMRQLVIYGKDHPDSSLILFDLDSKNHTQRQLLDIVYDGNYWDGIVKYSPTGNIIATQEQTVLRCWYAPPMREIEALGNSSITP